MVESVSYLHEQEVGESRGSDGMTVRTTFFLAGVCIGAALPLIVKAVKPLGAYALAGGMIAYEAACELIEASEDVMRVSIDKARQTIMGGKDSAP